MTSSLHIIKHMLVSKEHYTPIIVFRFNVLENNPILGQNAAFKVKIVF